MNKATAADRASILVRIPLDCKAYLEKLADYHCSSQSAVAVQILRAAMAAERPARAQECRTSTEPHLGIGGTA